MSFIRIIAVFIMLFLRLYQNFHCSTNFPSVLLENSISELLLLLLLLLLLF